MTHLDYRWALEMRRPDGSRLGQFAISPDWNAAREWTRFAGARRGAIQLGAAATVAPPAPVWHARLGAPFTSGFTLELASDGSASDSFPIDYFNTAAQQASTALVSAGALLPGEEFVFFPLAYRPDAAPPAARTSMQELDALIEVHDTPVQPFLCRAALQGAIQEADDVPLFVPQHVIDEVTQLTRGRPDREVGGILIGHVHRATAQSDEQQQDLFLEVTAQVSANAAGDGTTLSFTPDTWTDVNATIDLRKKGERMLGWWHSHILSVLCGSCPLERQRECSLAAGFLSADDKVLHAAVFPRAYSVAMVMSLSTEDEVTTATFGWRRGSLARRGIHILDARGPEITRARGDSPTTNEGAAACTRAVTRSA